MAEFNQIKAYVDGVETDSQRAGYVSKQNRVLAFHFETGASGASGFYFLIKDAYNINNPSTTAAGCKFAFAITPADNTDYASFNGGGDGEIYNGVGDGPAVFTASSTGSQYYNITGTLDGKILLPNTAYVLWLFPNYIDLQISTSLGYGAICSFELEGAAGVVRIKEGDRELIATPIVKEGDQFIDLAATIKQEGTFAFCV